VISNSFKWPSIEQEHSAISVAKNGICGCNETLCGNSALEPMFSLSACICQFHAQIVIFSIRQHYVKDPYREIHFYHAFQFDFCLTKSRSRTICSEISRVRSLNINPPSSKIIQKTFSYAFSSPTKQLLQALLTPTINSVFTVLCLEQFYPGKLSEQFLSLNEAGLDSITTRSDQARGSL
jgi:hypothetical protein